MFAVWFLVCGDWWLVVAVCGCCVCCLVVGLFGVDVWLLVVGCWWLVVDGWFLVVVCCC